jgi:threonine aldolase
MKKIDLRSDTVTLPTRGMREAMANAEVGDDVFGEDPTVNRLETLAAEMTGKEKALFVASGTMANLICQMSHCTRGDEMILGDQSHIFIYEQGGSAAIGGIHSRTLANQKDGTLDLNEVESAIRGDNIHFPRSRLLVLENTHNRCNGSPLDPDYMAAASRLAKNHGLFLHVDGARIFNAAVCLRTGVKDLLKGVDSISFCLSKGLSAPVGSMVCGSSDFIQQARRVRKVLGGGMRQAGILAAAGIIALTQMVDRLEEDHEHARIFAEGIAEFDGIIINPDDIQTNIVFFDIDPIKILPAEAFVRKLEEKGVRIIQLGPCRLRAVTHRMIDRSDIDEALTAIKKVIES